MTITAAEMRMAILHDIGECDYDESCPICVEEEENNDAKEAENEH